MSSVRPHTFQNDYVRAMLRRYRALALFVFGLLFSTQAALLSGAQAAPLAQTGQPAQPGTAAQPPRDRNATFGIQPATAKGPDSRTYFFMGATPGARLFDHVAVRNYSLRPLPLTVHTADALNTPTGDFAVTPPNQANKEVGTWIALFPPHGTNKIVVPARSFVVIPFTVAVPLNAQPGDHAGGITVTLESTARSSSGQNFKLLQSVGSRVFIRIGGKLHPQLTVENLRVSYDAALWPFKRKAAVVTYTVHNTGNVSLGGLQTVRISGLLHLRSQAKDVPPLGLLLPGFSATQRVIVRGVIPQLWMNADVSLRPLVLPGTTLGVKAPFTRSVHFWAIPWLLIGLIVFLAASWLLYRRRRHRRDRMTPEVVEVPASEPELTKTAGVPDGKDAGSSRATSEDNA